MAHTPYSYANLALTVNGDTTGNENAIGNYSVTPERFFYQPKATDVFVCTSMHIFVRDTGNFSADNYGGLLSPLTNGITVGYELNGDSQTLTMGIPVKSNADWGLVANRVAYVSFGSGDNFVTAEWSFEAHMSGGLRFEIFGATNDKFFVDLNDDFTGLVDHHFALAGYLRRNFKILPSTA